MHFTDCLHTKVFHTFADKFFFEREELDELEGLKWWQFVLNPYKVAQSANKAIQQNKKNYEELQEIQKINDRVEYYRAIFQQKNIEPKEAKEAHAKAIAHYAKKIYTLFDGINLNETTDNDHDSKTYWVQFNDYLFPRKTNLKKLGITLFVDKH